MDNKNLNEVKSLIIIKQNIVSKINNFIKEIFYKILVPKDKIKYDNIKRTIEDSSPFLLSCKERILTQEEKDEIEYFTKKVYSYNNMDVTDLKDIKEIEFDDENFYENISENLLENNFIDIHNTDTNKQVEKTSKEYFFELYSNIKKGNITCENLSFQELLKVNILLQEELKLKRNSVISDKEIEKLDDEILKLEKENSTMIKELKKLGVTDFLEE